MTHKISIAAEIAKDRELITNVYQTMACDITDTPE